MDYQKDNRTLDYSSYVDSGKTLSSGLAVVLRDGFHKCISARSYKCACCTFMSSTVFQLCCSPAWDVLYSVCRSHLK